MMLIRGLLEKGIAVLFCSCSLGGKLGSVYSGAFICTETRAKWNLKKKGDGSDVLFLAYPYKHWDLIYF